MAGTILALRQIIAAVKAQLAASNDGLGLTALSTTPPANTLVATNKNLLKFGSDTIEKATVWTAQLSQNVSFTAGDYWDMLSISFLEFGSCRLVIETSGNSQGSFEQYDIPISYANDVWGKYGVGSINTSWVILSPTITNSRAWGDRFLNQFCIALNVSGGGVTFRLLCNTTGEIRGAPFDYGNATINAKFYLSDNATSSANPSVLATTGTGMTIPSIVLPSVFTRNYVGMNQTSVGSAGGASALPATPLGYLQVKVDGTDVVIPYYRKS